MSALLWLDWKLLVNRVRSIRSHPRRLIPWAIFLVWLVPSLLNRLILFRARPAGRGLDMQVFAPLLAPLGDLVPGLVLLLLGLAVWRASARAPAAFESPADARFVMGAGLDARAVFAWLSLRTVRTIALSVGLVLLFFQVVYLPWFGISGERALLFTMAAATFGMIVFGCRLVAFNVKRAMSWLPIGTLGLLLALTGVALFGATLAGATGLASLPAGLETINRALPPGSWMVNAFAGDVLGEVPLAVLAIVSIALGIALAGDCYPELWETSERVFTLRRALLSRGGMFGQRPAGDQDRHRDRRRAAVSSSSTHIPGGAWTVMWKEWLTIKRGRGGLQLQIGLLAVAVGVGLAVGLAAGRDTGRGQIVAASLALLVVVWSWGASVQLGRDLGNPLWWLADAPLWGRLATWTLARGLRFAAPIIVLLEVAIAASGRYTWLLGLAPLPPLLLCWLMQAVALAGYALLPARSDYRLALTLRTFAVYAILLPLVISMLPGMILHDGVLLVALPALVVTSAIVGLIAFATWRIQGNGLAFAQEERQ